MLVMRKQEPITAFYIINKVIEGQKKEGAAQTQKTEVFSANKIKGPIARGSGGNKREREKSKKEKRVL